MSLNGALLLFALLNERKQSMFMCFVDLWKQATPRDRNKLFKHVFVWHCKPFMTFADGCCWANGTENWTLQLKLLVVIALIDHCKQLKAELL